MTPSQAEANGPAGEGASPRVQPGRRWDNGYTLNGVHLRAAELEEIVFDIIEDEMEGAPHYPYIFNMVYERFVHNQLADGISRMVAFAHEHGFLRFGDGEGGALIEMLTKEIEIYCPPTPRPSSTGPRRPTAAHRRLHKLAERDVLPKSRGGSNDLDNFVLACMPCNSQKGDRTPSEWGGPNREERQS